MSISYAGYRPGAIASVLKLHTDYYHSQWDFGLSFELKVASELTEFLSGKDSIRDLFLCAYGADGQLLGSITIDAAKADSAGAHLRWFIVSRECTGSGIGRELLSRAIAHCDSLSFERVFLTTFKGLDSARALYEKVGFTLESESNIDQWDGGVTEQRFVRVLCRKK